MNWTEEGIKADMANAKGWLLGQLNIEQPGRSVNCTICWERIKMGETAVRRVTGMWNGMAKRNYVCAKCGLELAEAAAKKFHGIASELRDRVAEGHAFVDIRMIKTYEFVVSVDLDDLARDSGQEAITEKANEKIRDVIYVMRPDVKAEHLATSYEEVLGLHRFGPR